MVRVYEINYPNEPVTSDFTLKFDNPSETDPLTGFSAIFRYFHQLDWSDGTIKWIGDSITFNYSVERTETKKGQVISTRTVTYNVPLLIAKYVTVLVEIT